VNGYIIDMYEETGNSVSGFYLSYSLVKDFGSPLPIELKSYIIGANDYFGVYVVYPSEG